jgi:hypothetical protein
VIIVLGEGGVIALQQRVGREDQMMRIDPLEAILALRALQIEHF